MSQDLNNLFKLRALLTRAMVARWTVSIVPRALEVSIILESGDRRITEQMALASRDDRDYVVVLIAGLEKVLREVERG